MNVNILKLSSPGYPQVLANIPTPPKQIYFTGAHPDEWIDRPKVAIVGSRRVSPYGASVTNRLAGQLAEAGVIIISGLALGIDSIAHQAALNAKGLTVAVLATSPADITPRSHINLAEQIIKGGGTIMSERRPDETIQKANFVIRNRIVSGLADILLITEASLKSGSLHTARFALEQGKTVMAVPGNITSLNSEGCNNLIKSGAVPVTNMEDILFALNLKAHKTTGRRFNGTPDEELILRLIKEGVSSQEELAVSAKLASPDVASALTMLEISGYIRPAGGGNWHPA